MMPPSSRCSHLEVAGYPEAILFATSSAPDTDFFVRLIDEDPAGKALEVCYGMVRVRHRNSLDSEELMAPGEVVGSTTRLRGAVLGVI